MKVFQSVSQIYADRDISRIESISAALGALLFGGILIFLAGFASPSVLHNAAHDARHTLNFPCH